MSYCNYKAIHQVLDAHEALHKQRIGAAECMALIAIARHANQESGLCWLSYETIAEEALMSRASAYRAVKALRSAQVIEVKGKHSSGALRYLLTLDRLNLTTPSQSDYSQSETTPSQSDYGQSINLRRSRSQSETTRSQSEILRSQIDTRSNNESIKEEEKELVPLISSAEEANERTSERAKTPTSRFAPGGEATAKATAKAKADRTGANTGDPNTMEPPPITFGDAPEDRLAQRLYECLGSPKPFHLDAVRQWPVSFRSLVDRGWTEADITGAITWAMAERFWGTKIIAGPGVAEFFTRNADKIIGQSQAAARAKTAVPSLAAQPASPPGVMLDMYTGKPLPACYAVYKYNPDDPESVAIRAVEFARELAEYEASQGAIQ